MATKWSAAYEMEYVHGTSKEQLIERSRKIAAVFGIVPHLMPTNRVYMEVGCGAAGGLLALLHPDSYTIAIDPLMRSYADLGWMPPFDDVYGSVASSLPLPAAAVDTIFCVECLDHCPDMADFRKSQFEMARVLSPKGDLYFMLPARPIGEHDGHPCAQVSQAAIELHFQELGLKTVRNRFPKDGTWLHMAKP